LPDRRRSVWQHSFESASTAKETDMIHLPDDDFENNNAFSGPDSAPPTDPSPEEPPYQESASATVPEPASENIVQLPVPQPETTQEKSFEKQAEDSFRMMSGSDNPAVEGMYSAAGDAYQAVTHVMRASAEEWVTGFTRLNTKLFEFGQLNAQNSMDFMRAISGVRTVRDAVDVQTAYLRGQYEAMSTQLRELQSLTTEIAGKTAQPFKQQFTRATQLGRMC
jgi:hypothetical protein